MVGRLNAAEAVARAKYVGSVAFTGRGYDPRTGTAADGQTLNFETGTKYGHIGGRTGFASLLDQEVMRKNVENQGLRAGAGSYRVAAVTHEGKVIPDAVVNIGGRIFKSNGSAGFHIVDGGYLKRKGTIRK